MRPMMAQNRVEGIFEMANLRPQTTKLPFVVWVFQRHGYQNDIGVKVSYDARLFPNQMGSYSVRPFAFIDGYRLSPNDERLLESWIQKNMHVLLGFWTVDIEYTEDMIKRIKPI